MGHIPKGTVERRRSLQHGVSANQDTACVADAEWQGEDFVNRESAGVMWEAAWLWIESHIVEYAERFSEFGRDGRDKHKIWDKLVRLRIECEDLDRQLSCIVEDVRG